MATTEVKYRVKEIRKLPNTPSKKVVVLERVEKPISPE